MKTLNYTQREEMKIYGSDSEDLIDYAHWQRFIEPLVKSEYEFPDFYTYQKWLAKFPGWSHGLMCSNHPCWKESYADIDLPMNHYYRTTK